MGKLCNLYVWWIGLALWLSLPVWGWGQARIAEKRPNRIKVIGDTTTVYFNTLANPTERQSIQTDLYEFEDVDVTWGDKQPHVSLGNLLTAPSFDLVYQPPSFGGGFRVGLDQYDRFRLEQNDVRYYENRGNRPFSDLYYSQINQKNNFIQAEFAHQFGPHFYLGLQYNLSNQTGFYQFQRMRTQNIGGTLRLTPGQRRYHGYFSFFTNAIKTENNGGITVDTVADLGDDFLGRVPVLSTSAQTRYNRTTLRYTQILYNKGVDSLTNTTTATSAWRHDIRYEYNRYKFFDGEPPTDGSLYGIASVNPRGIRSFIRHQAIENTVSYRQALGGSLTSAPLWLKVYVGHRWNGVYQEPVYFDVHNLSVGGIIQNNPQYRLKYRLSGQATTAERGLDFYVRGRLGYDLKVLGYLEAEGNFQRYQTSLIDRQLYVSWEQVWDNNTTFKQVQVFNFGGSYTFQLKTRPIDLYVRGEVLNHTLTNWMYYDSAQLRPIQAPSSINLLQVKARGNFRVGTFHLDNQVIWQPVLAGGFYFRVPELILDHNLYWQDWIFKRAMLAKVGVRFYYHTDYFHPGYAPLTGSFYLQNGEQLDPYPRFDAYVSFKIWQFRCFIRAENLSYFVYGRNYDTAYDHPITNFVVRIGFSWRLFE